MFRKITQFIENLTSASGGYRKITHLFRTAHLKRAKKKNSDKTAERIL